MEQYTDSQYDDDLTVGMEEAEESFDTGFVDLFEHSGGDESPIARLKGIVLSIDWEINDEVLTQFNDELIDLKDIWGDDPIKMVYVQALEKISKYIYQLRSDAHPNAIKLLLTFYYNLEKIVTSEDLTEEEKKEILREDVKKFEHLKQQIGSTGLSESENTLPPSNIASSATITEHGDSHPTLFNLKACILGMDWEITERELTDLSTEVKRLEDEFSGNKPKMIFLQGIGALGGYIKLKKSNAHADAFKLLYSFYEGLEKIVVDELSISEAKVILLPEVEKFETFKKTIASTITPDVISGESRRDMDEYVDDDESIVPAFADVPDEVHGFQADKEAASLGETGPADVDGRLDSFFSDDTAPAAVSFEKGQETDVLPIDALAKIDSFFDDDADVEESIIAVTTEDALKGVDVETEADDDSDEEALPTQGNGLLAPALAESDEKDEHGFNPDFDKSAEIKDTESESEIEDRLGGFFDDDDGVDIVDHAAALEGVNVETDADDDSAEAPLLVVDDEIAPALFGDDDAESAFSLDDEEDDVTEQVDGFFDEEEASEKTDLEQTPKDLEDRLDSFFGETDDGEDGAAEAIGLEAEAEDHVIEDNVGSFFADPEEILSTQDELADDGSSGEIEDGVASFVEEVEAAKDLFRPALEAETSEFAGVESDAKDDGSEATLVSDQSDTFSMASGEDEEITFEAIDETEIDEEDLPVAILEDSTSMIDDDLSSFGSGSDEQDFFAAIDDRVDEPGEFQMEILDETDEFEDATTIHSDDEIILSEPEQEEVEKENLDHLEEEEEEEFTFTSDDNLSNLRSGIASLGVEISDSIIEGILSEINGLRHRMMTKPVEKTFLQLLSTIVQHIGQYHYESSAEAHGLMLSVFDKLELTQNSETSNDQAQEILLAETCKILLWQQKMLDRQAVKKGDQLTFIDPLRADVSTEEEKQLAQQETIFATDSSSEDSIDESPEEKDFSAVFEPVEEDGEEAENIVLEDDMVLTSESDKSNTFDDDVIESELEADTDNISDDLFTVNDFDEMETDIPDSFSEDLSNDVEMSSNDESQDLLDDGALSSLSEPVASDDIEDNSITNFVKKEIDALRNTLRQEIKQLRDQLKDKE